MKNILQVAVCAAAIAIAPAFTLAAQEYETLVGVTPAAGIISTSATVNTLGTPELNFSAIPSPNKACTETAKFYYNDSLVGELLPTSSKVQMGVENQAATAVLMAFVSKPISSVGTYRLEVPAGFFTFDNGARINNKIEITWVVPALSEYTISPAPGYFESLPTVFTLIFPDAVSITQNPLEKNEEHRGVLLWDTPLASEEPTVIIIGSMVRLELSSNSRYTTKGTYALDIPEGAFTITYADGSTNINKGQLLMYYIPVVPYPSMDPAPGVVESIEEMKMYFPDSLEATFNMVMRPGSLFKANADGSCSTDRVAASTIIGQQQVKGKKSVVFKLNSKFSTPGKYVFKVGKSSFSANLPEFENQDGIMTTMAWNNCDYVWGPYEIKVSEATIEYLNPNGQPQKVARVAELDELTFTLPYAEGDVVLNPDTDVRLVDSFDDEINTQVTLALKNTRAGQQFTATFNPPITDEDDYVLYIPEGTFTVNGNKNPLFYLDITVDKTFSGVEAIEEVKTLPDVYRIDGTLVGRAMSPEQLSNLPKGFYIVGSKKVIIK
ncbi:MAG: hypothetical protein NC097_04480 [Clostridium sp.]|nr:hypothetical protein [Prevotella sp.]MCM1429034.1 hypothetical protein [Clostridium sp.]MCM1475435.1 hypothetical protein [Muribaculaceae bacterium]